FVHSYLIETVHFKASIYMVTKTENESIRKWRLSRLLIALMVLLTSCGISSDLNDISVDISTYSIVFRSERGFGNDRFDVYSFSLEKPENISDFHMVSEESEKFFWDFISMIDAELMDDPSKASSLKPLKAALDKIKNQEDGQYLHVSSNGTRKLYVYSPMLNTGYCLILVI
ncbi:MAG TPA: hypothetical protein PK646_05840, partial [Bacillota bacterium]|nr:hypothetical protein [Bacillota bacterium]HQB81591.1 hypothetical protein [Bacillota bacterium]